MDKHIDDVCWKAFEKSGRTGLYMLYKALKEDE